MRHRAAYFLTYHKYISIVKKSIAANLYGLQRYCPIFHIQIKDAVLCYAVVPVVKLSSSNALFSYSSRIMLSSIALVSVLMG